jgi:hypothetical protein
LMFFKRFEWKALDWAVQKMDKVIHRQNVKRRQKRAESDGCRPPSQPTPGVIKSG